ncbi:MAG: hypothetical protein LPH21_04820 [Shewanella sp.]|nr:hypothetical protein [Shewanella sp.]MCF1456893.1 hypothetical protein [Shewanella sp.]
MGLSKYLATKSKARIAEPFGQRLSSLSTALTLIYVEQLHHNRVALYKTTTKCCKNHLQRSTDPRSCHHSQSTHGTYSHLP